jgi:CheY-like chemotaxis protein
MSTVLLVHADGGVRSDWAQLLRGLGVEFRMAGSMPAAALILARERIAAIVANLDDPGSVDQLQWALECGRQPPLVLVSAAVLPSMASRASGIAVVLPTAPSMMRYALEILLAARGARAALPMRTPPAMALKWSAQLGGEDREDTWSGDHALA